MEPPTGSSFGTRSKFSEGQMKGVAHGSLDKLASGAVIWAVKSPFNFEEFNPIWMSRGWTFLIWSTIWFPGFPGDSHGKEPACQCRRIRDVVQSLGQEDSLQKEMAIHSNILAWRIPWTEEPGGLQSIALPRVGHDWSDCTHTHTLISYQCWGRRLGECTLFWACAVWLELLETPTCSFPALHFIHGIWVQFRELKH